MLTVETKIVQSRTGLWAVFVNIPYPALSNVMPFRGGYLSEAAAKIAAERVALAIGRTVERVQS
jgi:hypothetical protein